MKKQHVSVLLQEVIEGLSPKTNQSFVDATLGFAGHSFEILKLTVPNGKLVGIDQDKEALKAASQTLENMGARFIPFYGNFEMIDEATKDLAIDGGIIADLGVSSMQLDKGNRGFSFQSEGPLDMRMNLDAALTAEKIVNEYSQSELTKLIQKYSDEKFASRIAEKIVKAREAKRLTSTLELAKIVSEAIPRKFWPKAINPATRTFQAIRIAVNDEMGSLERFLPKAIAALKPGARLAIITFHGLEDKIVKDYFMKAANPCECPPTFPQCICGKKPSIKLITKKAIKPSPEEIKENPRSRSAKLRIVEKL